MLLFRRYFEHPYWTEKRTYSRAEAWLDCWANMAAWMDHKKLVGSRQVDLKRGEFLASDRFLMKRWGWSRGKVRRWIEAATEANEIRPTRETSDGTTYLVVSFDLMQPGGTNDGTSDGTTNGPATDQQRTKENEGNKGNEVVPPKKRAKRKCQIPDDWTPNETHQRIAKEERVSLIREAEKFRTHASANARRLVDWDAGFCNWLRNAAEFGSTTASNGTAHHGGPWIQGRDG